MTSVRARSRGAGVRRAWLGVIVFLLSFAPVHFECAPLCGSAATPLAAMAPCGMACCDSSATELNPVAVTAYSKDSVSINGSTMVDLTNHSSLPHTTEQYSSPVAGTGLLPNETLFLLHDQLLL